MAEEDPSDPKGKGKKRTLEETEGITKIAKIEKKKNLNQKTKNF